MTESLRGACGNVVSIAALGYLFPPIEDIVSKIQLLLTMLGKALLSVLLRLRRPRMVIYNREYFALLIM